MNTPTDILVSSSNDIITDTTTTKNQDNETNPSTSAVSTSTSNPLPPTSIQKQNPPKSRIKILKWRSVAKWTWGFPDDEDCIICQLSFNSACSQCKYPGDDCILLWGMCGHAFHAHCIMKWLQNSPENAQTCPHCRSPWEIRLS